MCDHFAQLYLSYVFSQVFAKITSYIFGNQVNFFLLHFQLVFVFTHCSVTSILVAFLLRYRIAILWHLLNLVIQMWEFKEISCLIVYRQCSCFVYCRCSARRRISFISMNEIRPFNWTATKWPKLNRKYDLDSFAWKMVNGQMSIELLFRKVLLCSMVKCILQMVF